MREVPRSPSEFYIRFLISAQEKTGEDDLNANEIQQTVESLGLDGLSPSYIREVARSMEPRPAPYLPDNPHDKATREYLRLHKIYDMWNPNRGVREAQLILMDPFLREKLEPLLLSSLSHSAIARKLRRYTSIALTAEGVTTYSHYFWNRKLLSQSQWMAYLSGMTYRNVYVQSLVTAPDVANRHLPYVMGISGPGHTFNSAEAAARMGQIAFKHALELEHRPATLDNTMALKNCMTTVEKADVIMRRSDVALRDVLRQFQKFRMKLDDARIVGVHQLTEGNYSKSGEGTDAEDEEDF
jgi:hypothetical protein